MNTYNGPTTVSAGGVCRSSFGTGIPAAEMLALDGGVLQNSISDASPATSITASVRLRALFNGRPTAGALRRRRRFRDRKLNGGRATLPWGSTVGTNIVGTLESGLPMAANVLRLTERHGLRRREPHHSRSTTIASSTADWAVISGVISLRQRAAGSPKRSRLVDL